MKIAASIKVSRHRHSTDRGDSTLDDGYYSQNISARCAVLTRRDHTKIAKCDAHEIVGVQ
jgi:hypothetical protein